ncbi:alginate lyase family protein [Helicobacter heilmannii]|uniref:alginate lyase family protein n=1 Tax=Helicobacter heilmannii TaxID=35817 RepID=UPI0006A24EC2|nr:alginate lyase family protein [Helicobacter heilmannii]CRF45303.1 FIG00710428: hypothetical protein [Helicobacter heilmannii]CRF49009.1 FIG00710428: hypothetical protein [Helicobacter heilmannii]
MTHHTPKGKMTRMRSCIFFLLFVVPLVADPMFFKNYTADNLPQALNLKKKLTIDPKPCRVLQPQKKYTPYGERNMSGCALAFKKDAQRAYDLSLGYKVTGKRDYVDKTKEILQAWATHLKDVTTLQGSDDINFYLPLMHMAFLNIADNNNDLSFTMSYNDFTTHMLNFSQATKNTNHGAWGILLNTTSALVLQDNTILNTSADLWHKWIMNNIDKDGIIGSVIARSDTSNYTGGAHKGIKGLAYTNFTLLALSVAGELLHEQGFKTFTDDEIKNRLGAAYHQIASWINDPTTFIYYQPGLRGVHNNAYFLLLSLYYDDPIANSLIKTGPLKEDPFRLKERKDIRPTESSESSRQSL